MVLEEEGKIFFSINKVPIGATIDTKVYVKSDGVRFTDGRTLKLEVKTSYVLHVEVGHAAKTLSALFVNSVPLAILKVGENKSNNFMYKATFDTTTVRLTQDSERDTLIICAHLEGVGALMIPLQTKYYSQQLSKKSRIGAPLGSIFVQYRSQTTKDGKKSYQIKKAVLLIVSSQVRDEKRSILNLELKRGYSIERQNLEIRNV
ncbi:hypothetical protein ACHWQZ_G000946 [Mnemiopsis leidyi]